MTRFTVSTSAQFALQVEEPNEDPKALARMDPEAKTDCAAGDSATLSDRCWLFEVCAALAHCAMVLCLVVPHENQERVLDLMCKFEGYM